MLKPDRTSMLVFELEPGDNMLRPEFEQRCAATPNLNRAELIEGIVYMAAATRFQQHGGPHSLLMVWLKLYEMETPFVEAADAASVRLDLENMPQPDGLLFIAPDRGGRVTLSDDGYIEGAPELLAEVSASSVSMDLGVKMRVYQRHGVQEYIVWRVLENEIDWFVLREQGYERLAPVDGVYRSELFGGLWLNIDAMLQRTDKRNVLTTLHAGLASEEHARFVARLAGGK